MLRHLGLSLAQVPDGMSVRAIASEACSPPSEVRDPGKMTNVLSVVLFSFLKIYGAGKASHSFCELQVLCHNLHMLSLGSRGK